MSRPRPEARLQYPLCVPRGDVDANDLRRYYEDLETSVPNLFAADETICHVELRSHVPGRPPPPSSRFGTAGPPVPPSSTGKPDEESSSGIITCREGRLSAPVSLSTAESLQSVLDTESSRGSTRIYTIYRANSWSRMQLTVDMFRMLCAASDITPRMLDLLRGMQSKSAPGDEHLMRCYYAINGIASYPGGTANKSASAVEADPWFGRRCREFRLRLSAALTEWELEVCYNLRHFERHGRDLKDPWSCRQTVFHHRHAFADRQSSWIVVQPSAIWQRALDDVRIGSIVHPLFLHLRSLSSAVANTSEYLEYLSGQLLSLDKRAAFPKPLAAFDFDFTLSQQVHAVRKKLHRVRTILDGTARTAAALSSLGGAVREPGGIPTSAHNAFSQELGYISRELGAYNGMADELLSLSSDIKSTINSVIEFRNQKILNSNSIQLKCIAEDSSRETQAMVILAKHTYTDSRTMRIATVIALIYLPASLVLTFFSTVFVDIRPPGSITAEDGSVGLSGAGGAQLVVDSHIWIAILSLFILSFGTAGCFWLWDRRSKQATTPTTSKC